MTRIEPWGKNALQYKVHTPQFENAPKVVVSVPLGQSQLKDMVDFIRETHLDRKLQHLYTPLYADIVVGSTYKAAIPVDPGEEVRVFQDAEGSVNTYMSFVAAYVRLMIEALGEKPPHDALRSHNGIVFIIDGGDVQARAAGILDVTKPTMHGAIRNAMKNLVTRERFLHIHELQRLDREKNPTAEASLMFILNGMIQMYRQHGLQPTKLIDIQQRIETLIRSQPSTEKAVSMKSERQGVPVNGGDRVNGVTVMSEAGQAAARQNAPVANNSLAGNVAQIENANNNNRKKNNARSERPARQTTRNRNNKKEDPENIGRQGILWRIGNMLREHGGNEDVKNMNRNSEREYVPAWMRHVYGNRRSRKILGYDTNNNKTKGRFGFTFRTISFKPTHSFIPRHH